MQASQRQIMVACCAMGVDGVTHSWLGKRSLGFPPASTILEESLELQYL